MIVILAHGHCGNNIHAWHKNVEARQGIASEDNCYDHMVLNGTISCRALHKMLRRDQELQCVKKVLTHVLCGRHVCWCEGLVVVICAVVFVGAEV